MIKTACHRFKMGRKLIVAEMQIQERVDSEEENAIEEVEEIENTEKRLYNGYQGPLTETEENNVEADVSSGSERVTKICSMLLLLIILI